MLSKNTIPRLLLAVCATLTLSQANAGIVITGTRVIFPANQQEVTVKLNNNGSKPSLMQAWVDTGNIESTPTTSDAPFVLSPAISRIDPAKGQSLRLMFTGASLPQDKETVFWLNVLDVPPKPQIDAEQNTMQMAFRSRIKIFYRPDGLKGSPEDAIEQLKWQLLPDANKQQFLLQAVNNSSFHVSFVKLALVIGDDYYESEDGMIPPGQTKQFPLPARFEFVPAAEMKVAFQAINDYGAFINVVQPLSL